MPLSGRMAVIDVFTFLLSVCIPGSQKNKCPVGYEELIAMPFEWPMNHEDLEILIYVNEGLGGDVGWYSNIMGVGVNFKDHLKFIFIFRISCVTLLMINFTAF